MEKDLSDFKFKYCVIKPKNRILEFGQEEKLCKVHIKNAVSVL